MIKSTDRLVPWTDRLSYGGALTDWPDLEKLGLGRGYCKVWLSPAGGQGTAGHRPSGARENGGSGTAGWLCLGGELTLGLKTQVEWSSEPRMTLLHP